jgi:hypothetical protein
MDMRKYSGESFVKIDDVRGGSIQAQIAAVKQGKFDKPDLVFETGDVLSLNATNNKTLIRAYGPNSKDWHGKAIEMLLGEVEFQKKMQEAVIVRPVSPLLKPEEQTPLPPASSKGDGGMDDEIPF